MRFSLVGGGGALLFINMDQKLFDENSEKVQGKKSPASTEKVQIIKE